MTEPSPPEIADLAAVKALAHPLRQRILRQLDVDGMATSTTLAAALGETTGGTSYNLRVLAEYGFVEEVAGQGRGRERWWRKVNRDLRFPREREQSPQLRSAMSEMHRTWLATDLEAFAKFQLQRHTLGEWADAVPYSRGAIHVTAEQLVAFFEEYLALLKRYQQPAASESPQARRILTRFIAFPAPDMEGDPS